MTKTRMAFFIGMLMVVGQLCFAQTSYSTLSKEDSTQLSVKISQKLDDFLSYLSQIGSKKVTNALKDSAIKGALDLFIGKGYSYIYEDDWGNQKTHNPVTMQTTNKSGRVYKPKPMTTYLANLRDLTYKEVRIERAAAVRVDAITPTGIENQYRAVAYYYQNFVGVRGDGSTYFDYTQKKVSIYLERVQLLTPDGVLTSWKVLLGDVAAVETH